MSELRESELRDLLERVSAIDGQVDVDEQWTAGRRRRTRRGAGVALVAGVVLVAGVSAVAQTGLLDGPQADPTPTGPAAVPDDLDTFVFAAPGAAQPLDQPTVLRAATPQELAGTRWMLQDGMWKSPTAATDLTGTTEPTEVRFGEDGGGEAWSVTVDGCGLAQVPELRLDEQGRFTGTTPRTSPAECAEDVQAAEDFWLEALSRGGTLTRADDQWLLLSVQAPARSTPSPTDGPRPMPTVEPGEDEDPADDGGTAAPAPSPSTPTGDGTSAPATGASPPPSPAPGDGAPPQPSPTPPQPSPTPPQEPVPSAPSAPPPAGEAFLDPAQESVDQPWPGGGGELFAPTVRAGVHEGFDRVVVDLTGSGDPGWRAAYTDDPRLDGSGARPDVAGDSVLQLSLTGMGYPEPGSGLYSEGIFGLDTHALGAVVEVQRTTPFEGMLQVFVGMRGEPRPYRIFLLEDPMRLVVDVQTSG